MRNSIINRAVKNVGKNQCNKSSVETVIYWKPLRLKKRKVAPLIDQHFVYLFVLIFLFSSQIPIIIFGSPTPAVLLFPV